MTATAPPIQIRWPEPGDSITAPSGHVYGVGPVINEGGYALVFEGKDELNRNIVVKVYKPMNRAFDDVRAQWMRESALMRKLAQPHVTSIFDAFIVGNLFCIVMERAWGSVDKYVRQVGALHDGAVRALADQILRALQHTHQNGVLHRDITIYNTLVFSDPATNAAFYKLADFGVSKEFTDPWTPKIAYTEIAHPAFRPPEFHLASVPYSNERTDLHHVGLVLLFALRGQLPMKEGMSPQELQHLVVGGAPRLAAEAVGTPLGNFIAVLCRRTNEARFSTAIEAWGHLQRLPP